MYPAFEKPFKVKTLHQTRWTQIRFRNTESLLFAGQYFSSRRRCPASKVMLLLSFPPLIDGSHADLPIGSRAGGGTEAACEVLDAQGSRGILSSEGGKVTGVGQCMFGKYVFWLLCEP
jgi:hypothetical protein